MMKLIDDVNHNIRQMQSARSGSARQTMVRRAIKSAVALDVEKDKLEEKLTKQDAWFWQHPDHPQTEERIDQWIGTLREYERCCVALREAKTVLLS